MNLRIFPLIFKRGLMITILELIRYWIQGQLGLCEGCNEKTKNIFCDDCRIERFYMKV